MKNKCKSLFAMLLVICYISIVFSTNVKIKALSNPVFSLVFSQSSNSNSITVSIALEDNIQNVGGLRMGLSFDKESLSYLSGSRDVLLQGVDTSDLGSDVSVGNKVNFVWSGSRNKGLTVNGLIVSYTFLVDSSVTAQKEIPFTLNVYEFFKADNAMTDIIYSNIQILKSTTLADSDVINVEKKINEIGTVVYNNACLQRIRDAREAYSNLVPLKQTYVSNLYILSAAEMEYERLKNSASDLNIKAKAQEFRTKYQKLLSKTIDELNISDEDTLNLAIAEWKKLDLDVRAETISDKRLLNSFSVRMTSLKNDLSTKKEAEEIAKKIRITYSGVFALSSDISSNILKSNKANIQKVLDEINENAEFNKYINEIMESDIRQLQGLMQIISKLPDSETENSNKTDFENEFGWILNLEVSNVSKDDIADIKTAIYVFEKLDAETQEILKESKSHLDELLSKAESLKDVDQETKTDVIYKTKTEYKTKTKYIKSDNENSNSDNSLAIVNPNKKLKIAINNNSINIMVWIMMGIFIIGAIACGAMFIIYRKLLRHQRNGSDNIEN